MGSTCEARRRFSCVRHCPVGDSARGQLLLPVELCSTPMGVLSLGAQPLTQALSLPG